MRAALLGLAALLLSSVGCSQYKYYDFDTSLDPAFSFIAVSEVQYCDLAVTGAESWSGALINEKNSTAGSCHLTSKHMGIIEYSSLADSGSLTFTINVKDGPTPDCLIGQGTKTVSIGPGTVSDTFTVMRMTDCACGVSCKGGTL